VGRWATHDQLPASADVVRIARLWGDRVGPARVHLVCGRERARAVVASALRVQVPAGGSGLPLLDPESADVVRRVNGVLQIRLREGDQREVRRTLAALLPQAPVAPVLVPPDHHRRWVHQSGQALASGVGRLAAAGYHVDGDPAVLARPVAGRTSPYREVVLERMLDAVLGAARRVAGRLEGPW
jgi:hypothetical protein